MSSCGEDGGSGGGGGPGNWVDGRLPAAEVYNPSGFAEAGPMLADSQVTLIALDSVFNQVGAPYFSGTKYDDSGSFIIYADITAASLHTKVEGSAFNETSGGIDNNVVLESIVPASASSFNANYFSSIVSIVGNYWFHDPASPYYQNTNAFQAAESAVLSYFDYSGLWGSASKKSYEMTLSGNTLDDAKLVMINSTLSKDKSGPEQGSFKRQIAQDIYTGENAIKSSVNAITSSLKIKAIKDNLDGYYSGKGLPYDCAPIWNLPELPDYYADILNRTPAVLDQKNVEYSAIGAIDNNDNKTFAFPIQLINSNPKYISLNLENATSIWTAMTHVDGYISPASKVADLEVMREVLLETPAEMDYNYKITGNLTAGVQYFVVTEFEENARPSKLQEGDIVPFGYNLASTDGVNWTGFSNASPGLKNRSIKYYTTD
jgi:hypothetical protein